MDRRLRAARGARDALALDDGRPDSVTPGFVGFVAIALIAVVVVFLIIDMLRRIRRAGYRADVNGQLDAEAQAAAEAEAQGESAERATDVDDQDIDPRGGAGR